MRTQEEWTEWLADNQELMLREVEAELSDDDDATAL